MLSFLICFGVCRTNTSAAGAGWTRVKSKNFYLIGNADEKIIRDTAVRLEQFRESLRQVLSPMNVDSPVPTTVVVFRTADDYKPFKPIKSTGEVHEMVAGYFLAGADKNYITLSGESGERANAYNVIFHEYTHFLIRNNLGESKIPPWYNEGAAAYYETFAIENDQKITLGGTQKKYLSMLGKNNLIPFEDFFNTDNYTLHEQGNDRVGLFYAQAWALMHYLIQGRDGAGKPQLEKFLRSVMSGKAAKASFLEAFQINYTALEAELKNYIRLNKYPVTEINLKEKINYDSEIHSSAMSDGEAESYLGDLLYRSNRLNEAEAQLQNALKLNPDSAVAQSSMALIKLKQNNIPEAEKYLEKALQTESDNYLVYYTYAYILSRRGMSEYGFVSEYDHALADKMRGALKKAIALNPNFAESYSLYALVNVVRNEEIELAIEYLDRALKIAPGNQWYLIRLSELYMRKEDFTLARSIAAKVTQTASDQQLKVYSQNTLGLINSTEAAYLDIKNNKRKNRKDDFLDRILTEEEFIRLRALKMNESLNQALYKPKSNEKRFLGRLINIDCRSNEIVYFIKSTDGVVKLRSKSFYPVNLTAYTTDMAAWQIGCGAIEKESLAVFNYRPPGNNNGEVSGDIVSIEFVPKDFSFLN